MSVRNHRIAAVSILAAGVVVLLAWGRSMAIDSDEVRAVRDQFQGAWVASLVQAGRIGRLEGKAAEGCRVEFDGKAVVFHGMVDDIDARGTFYLEAPRPMAGSTSSSTPAGSSASTSSSGDTLTLCLNPFAPPERLGVPTLPRARSCRPTSIVTSTSSAGRQPASIPLPIDGRGGDRGSDDLGDAQPARSSSRVPLFGWVILGMVAGLLSEPGHPFAVGLAHDVHLGLAPVAGERAVRLPSGP